jgi:hypothetical protein
LRAFDGPGRPPFIRLDNGRGVTVRRSNSAAAAAAEWCGCIMLLGPLHQPRITSGLVGQGQHQGGGKMQWLGGPRPSCTALVLVLAPADTGRNRRPMTIDRLAVAVSVYCRRGNCRIRPIADNEDTSARRAMRWHGYANEPIGDDHGHNYNTNKATARICANTLLTTTKTPTRSSCR